LIDSKSYREKNLSQKNIDLINKTNRAAACLVDYVRLNVYLTKMIFFKQFYKIKKLAWSSQGASWELVAVCVIF
jgi:hypothetical protein